MADTLVIGGTTYNNVAGFKATDSNDNTQTFIRPTGTKQISIAENGTVIEDVTNYASAEISVNVQGGGGGVQSGSYTPTGAYKTFSLSMSSAPQHLVLYSPNADFGTAAAWNTQYLIWNADDQLICVSHYSTSNFKVQTAGTVSYSNGNLTIDSLTDGLRAAKTYYWYAW